MVILDTNVIIDHIRRLDKNNSALQGLVERVGSSGLAFSVVTVQELYTGKSTASLENEQLVIEVISPFAVKSYSYEVARKAGELVRNSNGQLQFADAAIAATAIVNGAKLATLNKKDFAGISDLELL